VHTGGISSFSLVNLMIAHLMAEGYILTDEPEQEAARVLNRDLGHLLWGFFIRFGTVFDYYDEAVSIIQVIPSPTYQ
jgi:DNA polymerase sigma